MRRVTMRLVPHDPEDESFTVVDWKAHPGDMLEEVSQLLAPHGLRVVMADSQDDSYRFKVEKVEPRPVEPTASKAQPFIGLPLGNGEWV